MADKTDANIVNEVEKRLDDLFGDGDETADFAEDEGDIGQTPALEEDSEDAQAPLALEKDSGDVEESPLKELKSIVLSIDWEITDEIMTKFLRQVNALKNAYANDKIIVMFLQLLGSVGKYIKAKKANTDPDIVKLLNTAYAGLEKVILTIDISEAQRKKILLIELSKFKKLKERLTVKAAPKTKKAVKPPLKKRPVPEEREEAVEVREDVSVPAPAPPPYVKEEEPVSEVIRIATKSKGLNVGSKIALSVLLPLIIIAVVGYIYLSQLTNLTAHIDQAIQSLSGVSAEGARHIVISLLCGLVILIGLIAFLYGSKLSGRIKYLTHVVDRISAGETGGPIEIKTEGEIGALAQAISRMRDNLG